MSIEQHQFNTVTRAFITKRIDKKHQPSVNSMMCIFDGISVALWNRYVVCIEVHITSCAYRQIELSVIHLSLLNIVLPFTFFFFLVDDHLIAKIW